MHILSNFSIIFALSIFVFVYFFLITEKIHKASIVMFGAAIYMIFHIIPQKEAFHHIDLGVIFLLVSMMIIVKISERSGLFEWVAIWISKKVSADPLKILMSFFVVTAVFSALLDNVSTVLLVAPISILIANQLKISPIPFLVSQIFASNIGGTATLIGDPPNIMIGSAANLSFMDFIVHITPLIIIQLIIFTVVFALIFKDQMSVTNKNRAQIMDMNENALIKDPALLKKCVATIIAVTAGFAFHGLLHLEASVVAMSGAVILLIWTKTDVEHVLEKVEWATIMFFIGLFIMVGGLVHIGVIDRTAQFLMSKTHGNIALSSQLIIWFSGIFSGIFDNIPLVATFIPIIKSMSSSIGSESITPIWWALSLGSCLGGNGTIIGASANVIVFDLAKKNNIPITFTSFLKYSIPVTLTSLAIASVYIQLRYF